MGTGCGPIERALRRPVGEQDQQVVEVDVAVLVHVLGREGRAVGDRAPPGEEGEQTEAGAGTARLADLGGLEEEDEPDPPRGLRPGGRGR